MDIQLEKYKLIEWLMSIKDEQIISKIRNIQDNTSPSSDWNTDISETEKTMITAGLKDIENENTFTHQQVMEDIKNTYGI